VPSCYNRRKRKKETTPAYIDIILYIYLKKSQLLFPKRSAHHPIASHSSVGGCSIECYCVLYTRQKQQSNCLVCIGWSLRSIIPQHTQHTHKTLLFFFFSFYFAHSAQSFSPERERLSSARAWHSLYIYIILDTHSTAKFLQNLYQTFV
jgi:hypothetical protein